MKSTFQKFAQASMAVIIAAFAATTLVAQAEGGGSMRETGGGGSVTSSVKRKDRPTVRRTVPKRTVVPRKTAASYVAQGDKFFDQKDYDSALDAYENAVKLDRKLLRPSYRIGWIYNEFKEYGKALTALNAASAIKSDESVIYFERGYALRHLDRNAEAVTALRRSVELNPKYATALNELGSLYNELKRYNEALVVIKQALIYDADNDESYEEIGEAQRRLGQNAEAIASFNRAIQLDPDDAGGYMGLGDVYFYGTKEYQKSLNAYLKGLQYDSDNETAAYNVGWSYNELNKSSDAIAWLNKAIALKPDYTAAYVELGYANGKVKNGDAAINAYKKALQYDPKRSTALFGVADIYYDVIKDYSLAAEYYSRGLLVSPDDPSALYRLGYCYNDLSRYADAITPLARSSRLKPEWAGPPLELGYAYLKQSRYNESIASLKQAIAINRDSAPGHLYLGQAYVYTNNRKAAMDEYRELKRLRSEEYAKQLLDLIDDSKLRG